MKSIHSRSEFQSGVFLLVALILFAWSVFMLGRERAVFSSQEEFLTSFTDVKGLKVGAPIRLGGITIGRVSDIEFSNDLTDKNVHLTLLINEGYLDRVRTDSTVTIQTQGLLGDRLINISSGQSNHVATPGSKLPSQESAEIAQLLEKAGEVVENTAGISQKVDEFLETINDEMLVDLTKAAKSIGDISEEIEKGEGLIHRLIYSKKDGQSMLDTLNKAANDIGEVTGEIKKGDGLLHALIYGKDGKKAVESISSAAENLATTAEDISELAKEIKTGKGLLHALVYDESPEGLDNVVRKLNETASNLEKASKALASGGGTIGALLIDSQLYDNLVEVTDGAKRSFILRQAIKSSLEN